MTLFWFLLGIAVIIGIARYNESDKLFWSLFVSLIGTFLAVSVVCTYINSKKQNKVEYITSNPTQVLYSGSHIYALAGPTVTANNGVAAPVPVSKDDIMMCVIDNVLSKVVVSARDQPTIMFDTS